MRRTPWPIGLEIANDAPVGIVVVSYNTLRLTAQLIYSLYRRVRQPRFHLLVVDNASTDGSARLLRELSDAGICDVLLNHEQRYHGPGLNQGLDHLAARQATVAAEDRVRCVWLLDSDCVVIRQDTLSAAVDLMTGKRAGLVGQSVYDEWHGGDMMGLYSLLIDPEVVWRDPVESFQEHASPSQALQRSAADASVTTAEFAFTRDGYVVHLGRGTLRSVVQHDDRANRYYPWAAHHCNPHFMLEPAAPALYARFLGEFIAEVGELTPQSLITACGRYR